MNSFLNHSKSVTFKTIYPCVYFYQLVCFGSLYWCFLIFSCFFFHFVIKFYFSLLFHTVWKCANVSTFSFKLLILNLFIIVLPNQRNIFFSFSNQHDSNAYFINWKMAKLLISIISYICFVYCACFHSTYFLHILLISIVCVSVYVFARYFVFFT